MRTRLKARECGNLAASQDSFFIAVGEQCLGSRPLRARLATYTMPETPESVPRNGSTKLAEVWGYLAYVDSVLYGSAMTEIGVSSLVFAIDSRTGGDLEV